MQRLSFNDWIYDVSDWRHSGHHFFTYRVTVREQSIMFYQRDDNRQLYAALDVDAYETVTFLKCKKSVS